MTCRHRESWPIAGGRIEWCHACGAWRILVEKTAQQLAVVSPWCRVGETYESFDKRRLAYARARATRNAKRKQAVGR